MPKKEPKFVPLTPFQEWLMPALERRGINIAELARIVGTDYPHLWKIAKGDPVKYPTSRRPGYELTKAIGIALNDVEGAIVAAGYEKSFDGVHAILESENVTDPGELRLLLSYRGVSDPHKLLAQHMVDVLAKTDDQYPLTPGEPYYKEMRKAIDHVTEHSKPYPSE